MQFGHHIEELRVEYQTLGAAVFENELEFVRDQTPVERDHDSAYLGQSKIGLHELDTVHLQQTHPLALANPRRQKRIGHPIAASIQLTVGQSDVRVTIDIRFCAWRQKSAFAQKQSQIIFHSPLLLFCCWMVPADSNDSVPDLETDHVPARSS